uniref:Putative secreted protein n=1 Tax=Anopheles darlingi TaxID=43151 RepID=A0A2M4D133_ANODA
MQRYLGQGTTFRARLLLLVVQMMVRQMVLQVLGRVLRRRYRVSGGINIGQQLQVRQQALLVLAHLCKLCQHVLKELLAGCTGS